MGPGAKRTRRRDDSRCGLRVARGARPRGHVHAAAPASGSALAPGGDGMGTVCDTHSDKVYSSFYDILLPTRRTSPRPSLGRRRLRWELRAPVQIRPSVGNTAPYTLRLTHALHIDIRYIGYSGERTGASLRTSYYGSTLFTLYFNTDYSGALAYRQSRSHEDSPRRGSLRPCVSLTHTSLSLSPPHPLL